MFKRNLAVSDDTAGTPAVSTPTPAVSTPSSYALNTPVTPSTVGTPSTAGLANPEYPPTDSRQFYDEEDEGAEEGEDDVIRRIAMQNPFTPSNAFSVVSRYVPNWGEASTATPVPVSAVPVSTPTTITPSMYDSEQIQKMSSNDLKANIATWKTKLSASSPLTHNVVATANLCVDLDLKKIALTARNAEYNPRRFAAVIMRIREPKSTALVFKSGKLVVTGTKSEADAKHAARKFGRVIMKVGYPQAKFKDFKVENLVSTFTVPFPIHLEQLYRDLPANMHSQYEPEVFPGLIFKIRDIGTLLIFVSGKCVMIGMKTQEDIEKAFLFILPRLEKHRKK